MVTFTIIHGRRDRYTGVLQGPATLSHARDFHEFARIMKEEIGSDHGYKNLNRLRAAWNRLRGPDAERGMVVAVDRRDDSWGVAVTSSNA